MASRPRSVLPADAGVQRTVLREQVKELLLERILSHTYAPGERLVETRIAQELGISQAPVREALRDLESLRFVESAPFRGTWVRAVSDRELAEMYPIRAALEEVAARAAAQRLGGDVTALERERDAMAKARSLREQVEHDARFHRIIVEASGNGRLLELWESLQVEARTIITALRRQDPEAAGREIRRHVEEFGRRFVAASDQGG